MLLDIIKYINIHSIYGKMYSYDSAAVRIFIHFLKNLLIWIIVMKICFLTFRLLFLLTGGESRFISPYLSENNNK